MIKVRQHNINTFYVIIVLNLVLFLNKCEGETVNDIITSLADVINVTSTTPVEEVDYAKTIILLCRSNDKEHLFMFWQLPTDDIIVGPSNNFNTFKYNYEILSGNLTIRQVSFDEEGIYHCVSKGTVNNDINIRSVKVAVKKNETDTSTAELNYFRGVVAVGTILLVSGLVYLVYRIITKRQKKEILLEASDDDDSADEIYRSPGTSRQYNNVDFKRITEEDEDDAVIEIPKISIDFEDILQNAQTQ